jgi:hypothetical protein
VSYCSGFLTNIRKPEGHLCARLVRRLPRKSKAGRYGLVQGLVGLACMNAELCCTRAKVGDRKRSRVPPGTLLRPTETCGSKSTGVCMYCTVFIVDYVKAALEPRPTDVVCKSRDRPRDQRRKSEMEKLASCIASGRESVVNTTRNTKSGYLNDDVVTVEMSASMLS